MKTITNITLALLLAAALIVLLAVFGLVVTGDMSAIVEMFPFMTR